MSKRLKTRVILFFATILLVTLSCDLPVLGGLLRDDALNFEFYEHKVSLRTPTWGPTPEGEKSEDKEADFKFSLADCSCSGIQIPLDEEASSFHNNPDATYTPNNYEKKINTTNHLLCKWKQDYQSEELTSNIEIELDAFVVRGDTQAEDLVNTLSYEILEKKGYCENDDMCTVAMDSFSPPESLHYIEEWVWKPYGEDALPSDHWAHVTGFVRGKDRHLVYSITVNHPEQNPGDPWAKNNAYALEKCINMIWSSY